MASESKKLVVTVVVYGSDNNPIRSVAVEETGTNVELNLHTERHLATAVIDGLHDIDPDTVEIVDVDAPNFSIEVQSASKRDLLQGRWDAFCHRQRRHTLRKTKKNKFPMSTPTIQAITSAKSCSTWVAITFIAFLLVVMQANFR